MNIKLMSQIEPLVKKYNKRTSFSWLRCRGFNLDQIELLEEYYFPNTKQQFPIALREMLFLLGGSTAFDTGCPGGKNKDPMNIQKLLLEQNRPWLTDKQKQYFLDNRPIWVFDNTPEADNYQDFSFVYLDDKDDDPYVWRFILYPGSGQYFVQNGRYNGVFQEKIRLVEYVNKLMNFSINRL